MGFLETFDTTTAGQIPAGWVNDSHASVQANAVTLHSDPNALFASNDSAAHWAYLDSPDDGGGDNLYEAWLRFDAGGQVAEMIYRMSPGSGLAGATYYAFQVESNVQNGLLQRTVAGASTTVASVPGGTGAIPPGVPVRLRVLAEGARHRCEIFMPSAGLYVAPDGTTSATQQYCLDATDTDPAAISGAGRTGVLWFVNVGTLVAFDDLAATPASSPATSYTATASPTTVAAGGTVTATVTPDNPYTGTITGTPSGSAATGLSAEVLTFSGSDTPRTPSWTPTVAGTLTIAWTNDGGLADPADDTVTVTAPALVAGTLGFVSSGTGGISFAASAGSGGTGAISQNLQRSTTSGTGFADLAGLTTTTPEDTTATAGVLYFYRVRYTDSATPTAATVFSSEVTAKLYTGGDFGGAAAFSPIGSNFINGGPFSVFYKPSAPYFAEFTTENPGTGAAADADALPVATASLNGADDGTFALAVAKVDTGRYKITGTVPAGYARGNVVNVSVAATCSGVPGKEVVDRFTVDSKLVGDLNDSPYNGGTVAAVAGDVGGDLHGKVLGGGSTDIVGVGAYANDVLVNGQPVTTIDGIVKGFDATGATDKVQLDTTESATISLVGRTIEFFDAAGNVQPAFITAWDGTTGQKWATLNAHLADALVPGTTTYSKSSPQAAGLVSDKAGYALSSAGLDAVQVEAGINARQALSLAVAGVAGTVTGAGTGIITIFAPGTSTPRITGTTDGAGNRLTSAAHVPA